MDTTEYYIRDIVFIDIKDRVSELTIHSRLPIESVPITISYEEFKR